MGRVAIDVRGAFSSAGFTRRSSYCLLVVLVAASTGCGGTGASGNKENEAKGVSTNASQVEHVVKISAVGDTMLGSTPTLPPSPETYFKSVAKQLTGDIVFGNLEGTLTNVSESPKCEAGSTDCFAFRAPPDFAQDLRSAGFTVMSDANNHSFDFGQGGEDETVRALHGAGIAQTGLLNEVTIVHADGRRVAFLGFAPYSNTASLTDLTAARDLIKLASKRADIVVCAIHAGAEGSEAQHVTGEEEIYLGEDRGNAEEFAHMAIDAGADLILGSGPHVLRGMEIYRQRLIAYSLGNFSGYHNFTLEGPLGDSVVLHATLAGDGRLRGARLASVQLVEEGHPVPDPSHTGADLVSALSQEDFGASAVRVSPTGRIKAPG